MSQRKSLEIVEKDTDYIFNIKLEGIEEDFHVEKTMWTEEASYKKIKVTIVNNGEDNLSLSHMDFNLVGDTNEKISSYVTVLPITMSGKFDDGIEWTTTLNKGEEKTGYLYFDKTSTDLKDASKLQILVPSKVTAIKNEDGSYRGTIEKNEYYLDL